MAARLIQKAKRPLQNERGSATLEAVALFFIFIVMMAYTVGSFGIVHTGILNSIAARNYAFETFRNRTNLQYFRDTVTDSPEHYLGSGLRVHGIGDEQGGALWYVTTRHMASAFNADASGEQIMGTNTAAHTALSQPAQGNFEDRTINPVWIKTVYGICLNSTCTGTGK